MTHQKAKMAALQIRVRPLGPGDRSKQDLGWPGDEFAGFSSWWVNALDHGKVEPRHRAYCCNIKHTLLSVLVSKMVMPKWQQEHTGII